MESYVSLETKNTKMEYDQELLERRKMLKGEIETLERKLRDTKEELLQVEEELRSDSNIMDYGKNIRDNADGYESDRNSSEEKRETRKRRDEADERETNKKRRTVKRIIKRLTNEIEEEESKDNAQQTDTKSLPEQVAEIINGYGILKGEEAVLKLRWYNYAESFQMRIMKEMEEDLSISEQTARTRTYKEIQEIKKLSEEDYTRLRKITSKAERFYRVIEKAGGKDKIKHLSGISVDAITKLRKGELENLYRRLNAKEDTGEEGRICEIINEQSDT